MTRINDYIWHMPHTPEVDDPEDVAALQRLFNQPIQQTLEQPLSELGYTLSISDIHVPPDKVVAMATMANTYKANVRFVKYLSETIMVRIHFEHDEWALRIPTSDSHRFVVNLDRFKVQDRSTMIVEPDWPGRLTTRISNAPTTTLHYTGEDGLWEYETVSELVAHLERILEKFQTAGQAWLEDPATM